MRLSFFSFFFFWNIIDLTNWTETESTKRYWKLLEWIDSLWIFIVIIIIIIIITIIILIDFYSVNYTNILFSVSFLKIVMFTSSAITSPEREIVNKFFLFAIIIIEWHKNTKSNWKCSFLINETGICSCKHLLLNEDNCLYYFWILSIITDHRKNWSETETIWYIIWLKKTMAKKTTSKIAIQWFKD